MKHCQIILKGYCYVLLKGITEFRKAKTITSLSVFLTGSHVKIKWFPVFATITVTPIKLCRTFFLDNINKNIQKIRHEMLRKFTRVTSLTSNCKHSKFITSWKITKAPQNFVNIFSPSNSIYNFATWVYSMHCKYLGLKLSFWSLDILASLYFF